MSGLKLKTKSNSAGIFNEKPVQTNFSSPPEQRMMHSSITGTSSEKNTGNKPLKRYWKDEEVSFNQTENGVFSRVSP